MQKRINRTHFFLFAIIFLMFSSFILAALPTAALDTAHITSNAFIEGYVFDDEQKVFLPDMRISVERENLLGEETVTNETGYYNMTLPDGEYVLRIYDDLGFVIFRTNFTLLENARQRLDFVLDSSDIDQSRLYGTIQHTITFTPMSDAVVRIFRVSGTGGQTFFREADVDRDGKFSIYLPAGKYKVQVFADDTKIYSKEIELSFEEEREFELVLEKPTRALTLQNAIRLVIEDWPYIVAIIVLLVFYLFLNTFVDRVFANIKSSMDEKPSSFLDEPMVRFIEKAVKWNMLIIILIIVIYLSTNPLDVVSLLWEPISTSFTAIYTIIFLIIIMRIVLMFWDKFIIYFRNKQLQKKEGQFLSSRIITIIDIFGKYTLFFIFALSIVLTGLALLGMSDAIIGGFTEGLQKNAGFIIFIVSLIVISYIVLRFITSFFEDMKTRTTRFRPEMIDIASKGFKFFVYGIIGMIIIFTLLSAAGLGEIGQTIIIVFSLIIGLVVSMAATGSIGNILSGIVIMAFKPFEEGDWVIIAEKHTGQIIETNIMFTKVRDLESELIEIPNNLVLSYGIVNWTMAAKMGGFAAEIDASIGYDVPAKQVIQLMTDSCVGIPSVIEFPKPNVVMTEFQNHAIGYKLRAYIKSPQMRFKVQTDIMINMQKKFAEAGVEILSPEFFVRRSGKIPLKKEIQGRMRNINKFDEKAK